MIFKSSLAGKQIKLKRKESVLVYQDNVNNEGDSSNDYKEDKAPLQRYPQPSITM